MLGSAEWIGQVHAEEIDGLMRHYRIMPTWMQNSTPAVANFAFATEVCLIHLGEEKNVALLLETKHPDPGIRMLQMVSPKRNPKELKPLFRELAEDLHRRWFGDLGLYRVEAPVAIRRTRIISTLKGLGFKCDTYDWGIRNGIDFGKGREPYALLGLCPGDKVPPDYSKLAEPIRSEPERGDTQEAAQEIEPEPVLAQQE